MSTPDSEPGEGVTAQAPEVPARRTVLGLSRRALLALAGAGTLGAAAAVGVRAGIDLAGSGSSGSGGEDLVHPFTGAHQAGIVTPVQNNLHFAAFDVMSGTSRQELAELLADWTYAASRLTLGLPVSARGAFDGGPYAPADDTGEAAELGAAGLTLTFGFGASLFLDAQGTDRFGLAAKLPSEFTALPKMVNDFLQTERSGGDLCIQACADDPQVAVHAIRNLTRIAMGRAVLRWSQLGFGRASSTSTEQVTPRNLFGQKDGTRNLHAEDETALAEHVWIPDSASQPWAAAGSYLVARRINMTIEVWDGVRLEEQERVTGRDKRAGAPLSGGEEFTEPDFQAADAAGNPLIDERSHIHRVHPEHNDGVAMLRRGYNFVDGNDAQGRLDAGLFFIAFVREPERFAKVHRNMARDDLFVEYLKTSGSAVFLIPPGVAENESIGDKLFA